ncbi:hypothetical protein JOL62DRAFT_607573, partial [Phyllosticta paracitricarpa]
MDDSLALKSSSSSSRSRRLPPSPLPFPSFHQPSPLHLLVIQLRRLQLVSSTLPSHPSALPASTRPVHPLFPSLSFAGFNSPRHRCLLIFRLCWLQFASSSPSPHQSASPASPSPFHLAVSSFVSRQVCCQRSCECCARGPGRLNASLATFRLTNRLRLRNPDFSKPRICLPSGCECCARSPGRLNASLATLHATNRFGLTTMPYQVSSFPSRPADRMQTPSSIFTLIFSSGFTLHPRIHISARFESSIFTRLADSMHTSQSAVASFPPWVCIFPLHSFAGSMQTRLRAHLLASVNPSIAAVLVHSRRPSPLSFTDVLRRCPSPMSFAAFLRRCPSPLSSADVLRRCPSPLSFTAVLRRCPSPLSFTAVLRRCPSPMSFAAFLRQCPSPLSFAVVLRRCPSPLSSADVLRRCPSLPSSFAANVFAAFVFAAFVFAAIIFAAVILRCRRLHCRRLRCLRLRCRRPLLPSSFATVVLRCRHPSLPSSSLPSSFATVVLRHRRPSPPSSFATAVLRRRRPSPTIILRCRRPSLPSSFAAVVLHCRHPLLPSSSAAVLLVTLRHLLENILRLDADSFNTIPGRLYILASAVVSSVVFKPDCTQTSHSSWCRRLCKLCPWLTIVVALDAVSAHLWLRTLDLRNASDYPMTCTLGPSPILAAAVPSLVDTFAKNQFVH